MRPSPHRPFAQAGALDAPSSHGSAPSLAGFFSESAHGVAAPSVRECATALGIPCLAALAVWALVWSVPSSFAHWQIVSLVALHASILGAAWAGRRYPRFPVLWNIVAVLALLCAAALVQGLAGAYWAAPFKLVIAAVIAALVVTLVERLSWVLAVAVLISVSDAWSVFSSAGVSNQLMQADSATDGTSIVDAVAISMPAPRGIDAGFIGSVDMLFAALFVQITLLWGLSMYRTMGALIAALVLIDAYAALFDHALVPVLPVMALAFCVVHWRLLYRAVRDDLAGASRSHAQT